MRRVRKLLWGLLAAGLALAVGPAALAAEARYPQSILNPAGPQAEILYEAIAWDLEFITGLFIAVSIITAYILVRFKRRPNDEGIPDQSHGSPRWEIVAWLGLVVGLLIMLVHPLKAEALFSALPKEDSLNVEVIGHQWWWEIRYPDLGIVTANEMHIPAGKRVTIKTTSVDVIHAFAVPRLGGKNDSLPGRWTKFWLQADEPGVYQGQCMELCGASHARMLARVIAHTPQEFDAWVQARKNPVTTPQSALAQRGEQVFGAKCAACHTVDGTNFKGTVGPNQTGFGNRTSIGGGVLANTPENLATWLANPQAVKPGTLMPNLNLPQDEIDALVEYMMGLK